MGNKIITMISLCLFASVGASSISTDCTSLEKGISNDMKESLEEIRKNFARNQDLLKMTDSLRALPLSDEIKTWFVQKVINPSKLAQNAFINSLRTDENAAKSSIDSEEENIHWLFARLNNPESIQLFVNFFDSSSLYANEQIFVGYCISTLPTSKQKYDFLGKFSNFPFMPNYIYKVLYHNPALLEELRSYTPDNPVDEAITKLSKNLD
jgi:hypothetical protein